MVENAWSGREDSNLRPLPPEDAGPGVTARVSVGFRRTLTASVGLCSRLIPPKGSERAFDPCLNRNRKDFACCSTAA
jgi:hypothetical protein